MARVIAGGLALLSLLQLISAAAVPLQAAEVAPLPLVIWHGLGDDYSRDGLKQVSRLADEVNPGTYVHVVRLGESPGDDRQATFVGNVTEQIDQVCKQISDDPALRTAPAMNALGFSQGGQFLRGYIERCNDPPVHNLVTFGSQHNGISKFQSCQTTGDWVCRGAEALLRFGKWSDFVQSRFVPAQYFRDPEQLDDYLEHSNFLADINNERDEKNETYADNLASLNNFVMYMFESDRMVVPKETAHFAEVNKTTGELTPLTERDIYTEDWVGLKVLDDDGRLRFHSVPGDHMQISETTLKEVFEEYFSPAEAVMREMDVDASLVVQEGP